MNRLLAFRWPFRASSPIRHGPKRNSTRSTPRDGHAPMKARPLDYPVMSVSDIAALPVALSPLMVPSVLVIHNRFFGTPTPC